MKITYIACRFTYLKIMKYVLIILFVKIALAFCHDKLLENTGIITIATGGYNANDLTKSLRKNGKWTGNIYIYSDKCAPKINDTVTFEVPEITRSPLESKIFKMNILNETKEEYILFLDSDIKVNKPMVSFFSQLEKFKDSCDAYMPHDMWYSKKFKFNAGIIYVKRNKSENFLNLWKKYILNKSYKGNKDQPALKYIIENNLANICLIPDNLVYYLPDTLHKVSEFKSPLFTHYLKYKKNFKKCIYI